MRHQRRDERRREHRCVSSWSDYQCEIPMWFGKRWSDHSSGLQFDLQFGFQFENLHGDYRRHEHHHDLQCDQFGHQFESLNDDLRHERHRECYGQFGYQCGSLHGDHQHEHLHEPHSDYHFESLNDDHRREQHLECYGHQFVHQCESLNGHQHEHLHVRLSLIEKWNDRHEQVSCHGQVSWIWNGWFHERESRLG